MDSDKAWTDHQLNKLSKEDLIRIILQQNKVTVGDKSYDEWLLYQKIFDESPDALFLTRVDSRKILLCNEGAARMFELPQKEDFLGDFGYLYRHKPLQEDLFNNEELGNCEIAYVTKNGRTFWGLKKTSKIEILHTTYRLVRITDITYQKLQEERTRYTDELYRSVVNTQQEMVCRFRPDTTITFINEAYARTLDKPANEIVGKKFLEFVPYEDHDWIQKRLEQVAYERKPLTSEHIVETFNGRRVWHQWTDIPIYNKSGDLEEFQAVGLDITSRVMAEKKLQESEEKFRTLVMAVPVGIFLTDKHGNCTWVNKRLQEIGEISFSDALGEGLFRKLHADDSMKFLRFWKKTGLRDAGDRMECRYEAGQGEQRWVTVSFTSLMTGQEEVMGYVGIVEDITDRKKYEEEILDTKEQLEIALKAKDEFLSVMSHEIRTPLNSIIGFTHLLSRQETLPAQTEIFETLSFSSNHLLTLVNDILDFSKLQAGKLKLENIAFDLKNLAIKTLMMFRQQTDDKHIDLKYHIDPDLPSFVLGDPTRLGQILNNLLGNAVKFTNQGFVELSLGKTVDAQLEIKVSDSGIGMSSDEQQRIFEAFTQASSSTNRKYGGTGLGLSITKKLVTLQGGSISLSSIPGKGTTFMVQLPLEATDNIAREDTQEFDQDNIKGLKVLYVEDVMPNQFLMKGFCKQWGVDLTLASDGAEALNILRRSQKFDLVLMDIMMPGIDGYQTTELIRKMEGDYFRTLPIIAVTASVSDREAKKYQVFGMNDFVEKPIRPNELMQKIIKNTAQSGDHSSNGKNSRNHKNMFLLLQEYHEENPEEYHNMLLTTRNYIRYYQENLFKALQTMNVSAYAQQSHKLTNLLILFQENDFVHLLQNSGKKILDQELAPTLEKELEVAFNRIYSRIDGLTLKSKNLLN